MKLDATPQVYGLNENLEDTKKKLIKDLDTVTITTVPKNISFSQTTNGTTEWSPSGVSSSSSNFGTGKLNKPAVDGLINILKEIAKYSHWHKITSSNSRK